MTKAYVYIWPLMSKPAKEDQEALLIACGYRDKKALEINGHKVYRCT